MYEHFLLDMDTKKVVGARSDPHSDREEHHEDYQDPEFDEIWDAEGSDAHGSDTEFDEEWEEV